MGAETITSTGLAERI